MKKSRPWMDFDDCSLAFVIKNALRLQDEFDLGEADVLESSASYLYDCTFWKRGIVRYGSYHLKFYDVLPWEEVIDILEASDCHSGFEHFSRTLADITLRVGPKSGASPPRLICTIDENGGVEFHD